MQELTSVRAEAPSDAAGRLRRRLRDPDIAHELFFPADHAAWQDGRYSLKRKKTGQVRSQITGVRLHEWDRTRRDPTPEKQCQADVGNLVHAVSLLRREPGLEGLVLSRDFLRCRQAEKTRGRRIRFGLRAPERERFQEDKAAARTCHRRIVRAVKKSGYIVEHPPSFDPKSGMAGLEDWGRQIKLRRRKRLWPWFLPLLLLFFIPKCEELVESGDFFGIAIETRSLLVVVDKSSSMQKYFAPVKAEAARVLKEMKDQGGESYANLITYDNQAQSTLGGLQRVDDAVIDKLTERLDGLRAGGGTNLRSAIEQAAKEVGEHGKPTTLVILTDGEDGSIRQMLQDMDGIRGLFKDVKVVGNTLTPRLFGTRGAATPASPAEQALTDFAKEMKGRFGPEPEDK